MGPSPIPNNMPSVDSMMKMAGFDKMPSGPQEVKEPKAKEISLPNVDQYKNKDYLLTQTFPALKLDSSSSSLSSFMKTVELPTISQQIAAKKIGNILGGQVKPKDAKKPEDAVRRQDLGMGQPKGRVEAEKKENVRPAPPKAVPHAVRRQANLSPEKLEALIETKIEEQHKKNPETEKRAEQLEEKFLSDYKKLDTPEKKKKLCLKHMAAKLDLYENISPNEKNAALELLKANINEKIELMDLYVSQQKREIGQPNKQVELDL